MELKKIVLKPFCGCNANCYACDSRRELYQEIDRSMEMPFDRLTSILDQAKDLGTNYVAISGGEPLFYKKLFELIFECKKRGMTVALNTNGSLITDAMAEKLVNSGLNSIFISLDSYLPTDHDYLRRVPIWAKAVNGLDLLTNKKQLFGSGILVGIRTILTKFVLRDLDKMIDFGVIHSVDSHQLSYVEYDREADLVPSTKDIAYFRTHTLFRIKKILSRLSLLNLNQLNLNIESLFASNPERDYSNALYCSRSIAMEKCFRPLSFVIILQNGDVVPCNLVEYTHNPIIGNIYHSTLKEIWENNLLLDEFRKDRFEDCKYCPMLIHQKLNYFEGYIKGKKYNADSKRQPC